MKKMSEEQMPIVNPKESIKLSKNAKGDFQWEIKLISDNNIESELARLEGLNKKLEFLYGTKLETKK